MDISWTCDQVTHVCTASADLVQWVQLVLEAVWFLAGSIIAAAVVVGTSVILLARTY